MTETKIKSFLTFDENDARYSLAPRSPISHATLRSIRFRRSLSLYHYVYFIYILVRRIILRSCGLRRQRVVYFHTIFRSGSLRADYNTTRRRFTKYYYYCYCFRAFFTWPKAILRRGFRKYSAKRGKSKKFHYSVRLQLKRNRSRIINEIQMVNIGLYNTLIIFVQT